MDRHGLELSVLGWMVESDRNFLKAKEKGVTGDVFADHLSLYEFVHKYLRDYEKLPSWQTIEAQGGFQYDRNGVDPEWCVDQLLEARLRTQAEEVLLKGISALRQDSGAGIETIVNGLSQLRRPTQRSVGFTDAEAASRVDTVRQRKDLMRVMGGYFSMPELRNCPPGTVIGVIGRTSVGKSFFLQKLCIDAYLKGRKVLFVSPELTRAEVELRWDALLSQTFSLQSLMEGDVLEEAYKKWLEAMAQRSDWITVDSVGDKPFTLDTVRTLVHEYAPDVVAVDGLSLLDSSSVDPERGWQGVMHMSYGLQSLAVSRRITILVTQQTTRGSAEKETPSLHEIAYGDAFGQACSVIVSLGANPDDLRTRYVAVPKNRFGPESGKRVVPFNPNDGHVGDW